MRIDASGRVGILETSPAAGIHITSTNNALSKIRLGYSTSNHYLEIGREAGYYRVASYEDGQSLMFGTSRSAGATTERMRIDADGRVGVGVTSMSLHQMHVHGATGGNATFKVANTSTSGNTVCILAFMDSSNSSTSSSAFLQGFNGVTNYYLLGNGTHTFTSDEKVKKNIETTRDGYLEDLAKLRVVKYNWKHEEDGTDKELGLIAQEVEKVFPKLVMKDIDPQIEDADKNKLIKTTVLPFMLLKALQEANTKITALEARITTLEGE